MSIQKRFVPGLGDVWIRELTARESIDCQLLHVRPDGLPLPSAPFALVSAMVTDEHGNQKYEKLDAPELEGMRPAIFEALHAACQQVRDYVPPEELAKNLPGGGDDSPPTPSSDDQPQAASTNGSDRSASENTTAGSRSGSSSDKGPSCTIQEPVATS